MATGAFVRVHREGKWTNAEFDQLTDQELADFEAKSPSEGWRWAKFLAAWIRDNIVAADESE